MEGPLTYTSSSEIEPHTQTEAPAHAAILCRNLSKTYSTLEGQEVVAIKSVDLTVEPGEFLSIVGPSGCGKSTLLKLLAGLIASTSGEAHLFGDLIVGPRKDIGMVFQSPTLLEWRTVLSNTMLPIEVLGLDRAAGRQRALTLLGMTGLGGFEAKYPGELSGGMQQRVSLSRALVHDPALLLMDEPFGALDALTRETMGLELQKIWQESGKTVVLITHSISEAVFLGDRVSVMSPRPGQLLDFLKIDLPRPRSLDMMGTEAFGKSLNEVRKIMDRDSSS